MSSVFNLLSDRSLSNYDTLDGQSKEGILHEMLLQMEDEFNQRLTNVVLFNQYHKEWIRSGVLKVVRILRMKYCPSLVFVIVGFVL